MADHTTTVGSGHPISTVVCAARTGFAGLVDQATWSLGGAETRDLLLQVTALAAQVTELQARLLTHGEATGATTTDPLHRPSDTPHTDSQLAGFRRASRAFASSVATHTQPSLAHAARSYLANTCSLDLGRKTRFHTAAQRLAIAIEQKHCQHPLCDTPAWLCHTHHTVPWSRGGSTNTTDAKLRCPRHHALVHKDPPDPPLRT